MEGAGGFSLGYVEFVAQGPSPLSLVYVEEKLVVIAAAAAAVVAVVFVGPIVGALFSLVYVGMYIF